jgi:hypothetical protein
LKPRQITTASILLFILAATISLSASDQPALSGKWKFSWEARIGTEIGTLQLEQTDSKLTGAYKGHLTTTNVSGTIDADNNVHLTFDFRGVHTFTLLFTGKIDGDKMAGKFEIEGLKNGYDSHGENVRPSNYSWNAVRITDHAIVDQRQSTVASKVNN